MTQDEGLQGPVMFFSQETWQDFELLKSLKKKKS